MSDPAVSCGRVATRGAARAERWQRGNRLGEGARIGKNRMERRISKGTDGLGTGISENGSARPVVIRQPVEEEIEHFVCVAVIGYFRPGRKDAVDELVRLFGTCRGNGGQRA